MFSRLIERDLLFAALQIERRVTFDLCSLFYTSFQSIQIFCFVRTRDIGGIFFWSNVQWKEKLSIQRYSRVNDNDSISGVCIAFEKPYGRFFLTGTKNCSSIFISCHFVVLAKFSFFFFFFFFFFLFSELTNFVTLAWSNNFTIKTIFVQCKENLVKRSNNCFLAN